MGGVAVGYRRGGSPRAACRPARSSRCCSQLRIQISQELLSRLRRAAGYFPGMPCYEHFVALQKSAFVPLVVFLLSHLGTRTGLYYIDSTALATPVASTGIRRSGPARQDGLVLRLQAAPRLQQLP